MAPEETPYPAGNPFASMVAPPAKTMSPPPVAVALVDPLMVLKTDPAQVRLTPVLFPSESAQNTSDPRFVVSVTAAELTTLNLDLRTISFAIPVVVMFDPIVRSLDVPVAVRFVTPTLVIDPEVVTV